MATSSLRWCLVLWGLVITACPVRAEVPLAASFGKTADGQAVEIYTLRNAHGCSLRAMTYGATIVDLTVPGRDAKPVDVSLGFDTLAGYESSANPYFGCTVGRVANRIAGAKFTLDGKTYTTAANNGPNLLHGGVKRPFHKVIWQARPFENAEGQGLEFRYRSPDGEEGFPGNLETSVTFLVKAAHNEVVHTYSATTDKATPVNLTNHMYFNLSGEGSSTALDHTLQLISEKYTPTDRVLIPTGQLADVASTPLDFRKPRLLSDKLADLSTSPAGSYDHNFIVDGEAGKLRPAARLHSPVSNITLEVGTTEPAIQLYAGVGLNVKQGKHGHTYAKHSAVCLESQHTPDSVNQPNFPSIILQPGKTYSQVTTWNFKVE